jgi:nitroimidazol reductase NimA-like FMN-containing flavoprotein (pyridoxamine 5'-phosphate oxidase superfamily)
VRRSLCACEIDRLLERRPCVFRAVHPDEDAAEHHEPLCGLRIRAWDTTMSTMTDGSTRVNVLTREESLHLLQHQSYMGRVGFVADGQLIVLPVNYLAEDDAIFFCSSEGTKLSALRHGAPVAFEVDANRPLFHSGWSVLVNGTAAEVIDLDVLDRLHRGPLKSWAVPAAQHWVRISIDTISGRQIPET